MVLDMQFESLKTVVAILFKDFQCLQTALESKEFCRQVAGQALMYMGDVERYREQFDTDYYAKKQHE